MTDPTPFKALSILDKLVVEHGAAAIQKVHIDLLQSVIRTLNDENKSLKEKLGESERNNSVLRETNQQLHSRNAKLVEEQQKNATPSPFDPSELEMKLLGWIAEQRALTDEELGRATREISAERLRYHLERLAEAGYVDRSLDADYEWVSRLTQKGREFLFSRGAL
jgi:predicted HTH transcriptional regulator